MRNLTNYQNLLRNLEKGYYKINKNCDKREANSPNDSEKERVGLIKLALTLVIWKTKKNRAVG